MARAKKNKTTAGRSKKGAWNKKDERSILSGSAGNDNTKRSQERKSVIRKSGKKRKDPWKKGKAWIVEPKR